MGHGSMGQMGHIFEWVTWVMGQCPLTHDPCTYFRIHSQTRLSLSEIKERIAYWAWDAVVGCNFVVFLSDNINFALLCFMSSCRQQMLLSIWTFAEYNVICVTVNYLCIFLSRHHMGYHGSHIVGHGSLLEWVNGSWVTVSDPLPALDEGTC